MATNVSSLRVAIRGDVSGLQAELEKGTASVKKFSGSFQRSQMTAAKATNAFGLSSAQTSMAVTQLGFAAEDAMVVYGNSGLAGALRAAGNNLSFVASMMNPIAGIAVGVGTALAAIVIPKLFETGKAADESAKNVNELAKALMDLRDVRDRFSASDQEFRQVDLAAFRRDAEGRIGAENAADNAERLQRARDDLAKIGIQQEDLRRRAIGTLAAAGLGDLFAGILGNGQVSPVRAIEHFRRTNPGVEIPEEVRAQLTRLETERQKLIEQARQEQQRILILEKVAQDSARLATEANAERVAGWFGAARQSIVDGILNAKIPGERPKVEAMRQSPGLQGGFQFGSREALSILNRTASGQNQVDQKIEKNTHGTEVAVRDVVRAVKDLGAQFVPALAGDAL